MFIYVIVILVALNSFLGNCEFVDTFSTFTIRVNIQEQKKAAEKVIERLLGQEKANLFELSVISRDQHIKDDGFILLKHVNDEKVFITAYSGVSVVWGVNYFLKKYCNCHVSWDGDQINLPNPLPPVNETVISFDKVRYYQNVCTSSYTFVWWDWARWEREIDWMAFNGINLALAFTGQEAIWQRVYDALGLAYNDFTGPAFLAWNRMGNLRNYSHGLSISWNQQQLTLQHRILQRLRELGITPVLPAFCGFVPRSFAKSYPQAKLTIVSKWNKFSNEYCCPYILDPSDVLFSVVGRIFLREYINEFGTNHIYNCDAFNENTPSSSNLFYLSNISESIYNVINSIDPGAIWLLQGWMFMDPFWADHTRAKAFVTGVPIGKMLILDLQSDLTPQYKRLHSYYGQPFIWCTLHNFGGQLGMYGHLDRINVGIPGGRQMKNSTMLGIGIAPEGIDQNYVIYDFTLDSAFRAEPTNLTKWISNYALRRYGKFQKNVDMGWKLLLNTVYNYQPETTYKVSPTGAKKIRMVSGEHISKNVLTKLPSLHMNEPHWYNRSLFYDIFQEFLEASRDDGIHSCELFKHDLIDVTRQTIQIAVGALYFKIIRSYALLNINEFLEMSQTFLEILDDLDVILASGKKFLLGVWLESAKNMATNLNESLSYEYNARNQITLWGPNGEIRDYAAKQWSGLVSDYYKPRWVIFLRALNDSLHGSAPYDPIVVKELMFFNVEKPFGFERKTYPTIPRGNPVQIVQGFAEKWNSRLYKIFGNLTEGKRRLRLKPL